MNTNSRNTCRLGRRQVKQDPRPLLSDHGTVEKKLATGKSTNTKDDKAATEKLKIAKKHTNSRDMECSDTMGNRKTKIAQKRDEAVQVRYSRHLRSTLDRER